MIRLYAVRICEQLSRSELISRVLLDVGETKRSEWLQMREERARESLSGILLLQHGMEQAGISPIGKRIAYGEKGKPYLQDTSLTFSISHANGLAVCAVERSENGGASGLGVDVETLDARSEESMQRIAERWFTEREKLSFSEFPDAIQFFKIWTGKEALAKWTGEGLARVGEFDVTALPTDRQLTVYTLEDAVVSLCHGVESVAPREIEWVE